MSVYVCVFAASSIISPFAALTSCSRRAVAAVAGAASWSLVPRLGRWRSARLCILSRHYDAAQEKERQRKRREKQGNSLSLSLFSRSSHVTYTHTHTGTHPFQSSLAALPLSLRFPFDV